jgi:hypothetical protein
MKMLKVGFLILCFSIALMALSVTGCGGASDASTYGGLGKAGRGAGQQCGQGQSAKGCGLAQGDCGSAKECDGCDKSVKSCGGCVSEPGTCHSEEDCQECPLAGDCSKLDVTELGGTGAMVPPLPQGLLESGCCPVTQETQEDAEVAETTSKKKDRKARRNKARKAQASEDANQE